MPNTENLLKMADWLETQCPQAQFDMHCFILNYPQDAATTSMDVALTSCQTVGCIVGSIPKVFGEFPNNTSSGRVYDFDWIGLSYRVFGVTSSEEWDWMFGSDWKHMDNTPVGAAKRIRYFLENNCCIPVWYRYENIGDLYTITDRENPVPIEDVVPWIWQYRTEVLGQPIPAPLPEADM